MNASDPPLFHLYSTFFHLYSTFILPLPTLHPLVPVTFLTGATGPVDSPANSLWNPNGSLGLGGQREAATLGKGRMKVE